MNGKEIKATLSKIEGGELYEIFNLLPDIAGGEAWLGEIKDCAQRMQDYLNDEDDYDIDDIRDKGYEFADLEVEDYHSNINARVQELSLWASACLDVEVTDMVADDKEMTLTKMQGLYLYFAMRQVWDAVADQAFQNTEEAEEQI